VGQQGKDVVWVPTPDAVVNNMLDMAQVTPADYVIDLGSGDGRTVIAAASQGRKGAGDRVRTAHGRPVDPERRQGRCERQGLVRAGRSVRDRLHAGHSPHDVPAARNQPAAPSEDPRHEAGTRVASNTFTMGDWTPDQTAEVPASECKSYCRALFWIVPAKVAGTWRSENGDLELEQKYQMVSGTMRSGNVVYPITNGRLKGEEITFTAGDSTYTGRVNGNVIEGVSGSGRSQVRLARDPRLGDTRSCKGAGAAAGSRRAIQLRRLAPKIAAKPSSWATDVKSSAAAHPQSPCSTAWPWWSAWSSASGSSRRLNS
jgi:hypothetical protein